MSAFKKATKEQAKLRLFLAGPSGSGKTWTALAIATAMGKRVAVIDTEHHSASKYADRFEFDSMNLDTPTIKAYEDAIKIACNERYDVLVIDSLTHAWLAAQQMVDDTAARMKSANSYMAWGSVTPVWNQLLRTIITTNLHVIGTCRSKVDYVIEQVNGKQVPRKIGMAPIMRDGCEYEFDVSAEMDLDHRMIISKTRCPELDGKVLDKPGADVAEVLLEWLNRGEVPNPADPPLEKSPASEMSPEQAAFNAWVGPHIKAGRLSRDVVANSLKLNGNDYVNTRVALEKLDAMQPAAA